MNHEELQNALPAYVADRLPEEDRQRLEEHLVTCAECRAVAGTWEGLAEALREEEVNLFEPHPDPLEVRSLALGITNGIDQGAIRLHVTTCASCELETQIWRKQEALPAGSAREAHAQAGSGVSTARVGLLCAAAGAVLGVALSVTLMRQPPATAPAPEPWVGATVPIQLPTQLRSGSGTGLKHVIGPDERRVVVFFPAVDNGFSGEGDYRFTITSGGREALSRTLSAAEARKHTKALGMVTFDLLATSLTPGRYECLVASHDGSILYRRTLDVQTAE